MIESKMFLSTCADIVVTSKSLKQAYRRIAKIANVEGVVLQPYEEALKESESDADGNEDNK